jgi:Domain of unknown function (DUF4249)
MRNAKYSWKAILGCILYGIACRQPYTPPVQPGNANYLVVSGFLNAGSDSTIITLSRTRNLGDSVPNIPELHAQVSVLGSSGETLPLAELSNGVYASAILSLNPAETYKLEILTSDGKKYLTDSLTVIPTPAIDSISWKQDTTSSSNKLGVTVYATTHDPQNNTRYYRWEYLETWEYHSNYDSYFFYANDSIQARPFDQHIYYCWKSQPSTSLSLATSAKLSQDLIFENPITFIPIGDQKLGYNYSILVTQFALSKEAYEYWDNLKKNTELTGSIFDPQPSQVLGNIHCVTNPDEPVLGYISATSVQKQRIFINNNSLQHWGYQTLPPGCTQFRVPDDSVQYYFHSNIYLITTQVPITLGGGYYGAGSACVDCQEQGGNTTKPSYWP